MLSDSMECANVAHIVHYLHEVPPALPAWVCLLACAYFAQTGGLFCSIL